MFRSIGVSIGAFLGLLGSELWAFAHDEPRPNSCAVLYSHLSGPTYPSDRDIPVKPSGSIHIDVGQKPVLSQSPKGLSGKAILGASSLMTGGIVAVHSRQQAETPEASPSHPSEHSAGQIDSQTSTPTLSDDLAAKSQEIEKIVQQTLAQIRKQESQQKLADKQEGTKEPLALIPIRSVEDLISEAEGTERKWMTHAESKASMGEFFIQSELADSRKDSTPEANTRAILGWRKDVAAIQELTREISDPYQKLKAARQYLLSQHMHHYCRDFGQLNEFYSVGCGNCDAETAMVLSAIHDANLPIPPGKVLGAQTFADHIQPVLYDPQTGEVQSLVNGSIEKTVRAPIYDPISLYAAYLEGKQRPPLIAPGKMLLKQADAPDTGMRTADTGPQTDTNRKYSWGGGQFSQGFVPEFAEISNQEQVQKSENKLADLLAEVQHQSNARMADQAEKSALASKNLSATEAASPGTGGSGASGAGTSESLVFTNARDLALYRAAPDDTKQKEVLLSIAERDARRILKDPAWAKTLDFLTRPHRYLGLSPATQAETSRLVDKAARSIGDLQDLNVKILNLKYALGTAHYEPKAGFWDHSPIFKPVNEGFAVFGAIANQAPFEAIRALDQLPPETFQRLQEYAFQYESEKTRSNAILVQLENPSQIGPKLPDRAAVLFIDFDQDGKMAHGTFYSGGGAGFQGAAKAPSQTRPKYAMQYENYFSLLFASWFHQYIRDAKSPKSYLEHYDKIFKLLSPEVIEAFDDEIIKKRRKMGVDDEGRMSVIKYLLNFLTGNYSTQGPFSSYELGGTGQQGYISRHPSEAPQLAGADGLFRVKVRYHSQKGFYPDQISVSQPLPKYLADLCVKLAKAQSDSENVATVELIPHSR